MISETAVGCEALTTNPTENFRREITAVYAPCPPTRFENLERVAMGMTHTPLQVSCCSLTQKRKLNMKVSLHTLCSSFIASLCLVVCVVQSAPQQSPNACVAIQKGEFLTALAHSLGIRSVEPASIDSNSGSSNSELVLLFKPISNVSVIKAAQGLRDTMQKTVLSPGFAGIAGVTGSPADPICSVSIYGYDQNQRVRIEADAITLSEGSVRVKLVCVTSPEQRKSN